MSYYIALYNVMIYHVSFYHPMLHCTIDIPSIGRVSGCGPGTPFARLELTGKSGVDRKENAGQWCKLTREALVGLVI